MRILKFDLPHPFFFGQGSNFNARVGTIRSNPQGKVYFFFKYMLRCLAWTGVFLARDWGPEWEWEWEWGSGSGLLFGRVGVGEWEWTKKSGSGSGLFWGGVGVDLVSLDYLIIS